MGACPGKTNVTSRIFINGRQEGQSQNRGVTAAALDRSESCAVEMEEGTTAERTPAACSPGRGQLLPYGIQRRQACHHPDFSLLRLTADHGAPELYKNTAALF